VDCRSYLLRPFHRYHHLLSRPRMLAQKLANPNLSRRNLKRRQTAAQWSRKFDRWPIKWVLGDPFIDSTYRHYALARLDSILWRARADGIAYVARAEMRVMRLGHARAAVAEILRDYRHRHPVHRRQGRPGVSACVKPDAMQLCPCASRPHRAL